LKVFDLVILPDVNVHSSESWPIWIASMERKRPNKRSKRNVTQKIIISFFKKHFSLLLFTFIVRFNLTSWHMNVFIILEYSKLFLFIKAKVMCNLMKTFCFPFQNCLLVLFSKFSCTKSVISLPTWIYKNCFEFYKIHQFSGHSLRHLQFHLKTNRKLFRFRKPKSKSKSKWDLIIHIRFLSPRGECCIDRWFRFFLLHLNDPHYGCRLT
jgi:hypothetical protein